MDQNPDIKSKPMINTFTNREITLLYMHVYGTNSKFKYLEHFQYSNNPNVEAFEAQQQKDLPSKKARFEKEYNSNLQKCLEKVEEYFRGKSYDAIITAPSKSNLHKDFFEKIKAVTNSKELFKFKKEEKAAIIKDFCCYYRNFSIIEKPDSENLALASILIVDDIYADGKTVGAIIKKLTAQENNIKLDKIVVFTPLLTREST